jgi:hypothetical protein
MKDLERRVNNMEKYFDEMEKMGWNECDMELLKMHENIIGEFLDNNVYHREIEVSIDFLLNFAVAVQNVEKKENE